MSNTGEHDNFIVEMKGVTKRFPGIVANDDVTIQIKKGEIYALLGENGAGKSTLMSMLFGMYEPDEGEIWIRGKKENISSPNYATSLGIGMVHQHFKLVENFTVTENIILGLKKKDKKLGFLPWVDLKSHHKDIAELSSKYGLEVDPTAKIENLGVSIRQRVEILKMLYREAEILIFDEPTAVLTPQEIEFLLEIIRGLRDSGKTIILITHKLDEIKQVADRCAILNRGKLIEILDVKTTDTQTMARLMVGREVEIAATEKKTEFGDEILRVDNLTVKNKDGFPVVSDVSFTVHSGEIFAIAGVSGNGQVEIADAIAGMLPVAEGSIYMSEIDVTKLSTRARHRCGIAYIPEDRHSVGLVMDFALEENLGLKSYYHDPYANKGILKKEVFTDKATEMIEKYDIRSGRGERTIVRSMSGGNQQKAIIGREIETTGDLIIFVQPTRGLDVGAIENIHKQIIEQRDLGRAVLLISLELEEIMTLADTIGVIYSGRMQRIAPASSLTTDEVGEFMMGVGKTDEGN